MTVMISPMVARPSVFENRSLTICAQCPGCALNRVGRRSHRSSYRNLSLVRHQHRFSRHEALGVGSLTTYMVRSSLPVFFMTNSRSAGTKTAMSL